ncbi:hypothetical protein EMCRGX_G009500 [Ephydatia muelleri]
MSSGHTPSVPEPRVTLGPWLAQVHTHPVGTWNSSESAPKCFATHKNGTHLDWYTPTLWVHGTAQSLPQSALQLTRMAPIFTGQLVHTYPVGTWNSSESAPKCFATHKNGTHLHWSACTHLPCGYMEQLRVCLKVLCNSQEWHPSRLVSLYTPTLWVHGTAQSLPQSALQLTRMAPISNGQLVHTYPVGTWNSSESVPKCFATHKNGTHLHWYTPTLWVHGIAQSLPQSALQLTRMAPIFTGQLVHTYPVGTWNSSECASKCFATHKNGTHLDWSACTHLPCGYMEQLRVCLKVLCNSQEWHPSPLVSLYTPTLWVHGTAQSLPHSALQLTRMAPIFTGQLVHTYPVGTWNSSESAPKCFATHKNGTHLHWSACTHLPCGYMEQLRVCPKVLCNSQEWHPSPLVSFALDPRVTLGPWLAQVHTYPVGTWNSSESAPKCFATHKNGTHLHWYTPTLWVHGIAQSLPQSALQLTRMAPIFTGQLVHTYPVGTWNSSECASKCFATHKNGTHLDWYTPTLWVHGTAQSVPQSALQLTRMAPILIGQHVHTYPVGTWNSSESAPKCFATHKNGTHLHWSACTHLPCGYMEQLRVCLKVLCNSQEWHPSPLVSLYTPTLWVHGTAHSLPQSALQLTRMAPISIGQLVHTYPVGTWNSSECASKCFATHKNGTHLDWYTPTLWVHGTAQSLPQSALQLTRMAPISIGQLVHTYPVGTWNSSESVPKCFATHKNGTHLHWYTPTLWVHGIAQSLPQSALQLTRMAPIFTGQLVHTYPVGTWNSSESAPKCFATHKNGTHLHCALDPRVRLGPWLAQVHTYPVGTWNSSESAPKCFATHKNGTHLHWYTPTLWVHGTAQSLPQSALQLTRMAPIFTGQLVHTYPVGTWNSSESASKCFATHKNGTHLDWYTPTLWVHGIAQSLPQSALQLTRMAPISIGQLVHTYPVGTWNSSESASKCFATHKNGTHLHWSACTPTLWVHGTAQSVPQSALQLTRMAPISIGQLVGTHLPCGYMEQLRVCLKVLCNSQEWHPSRLVSLYTPTLWVHGIAQSLPQSALQLTRMAPISIGQLVHTYPVGTWNSSESAPKCFATHKNGTHLHWYTPTLWVHGTAQIVPQSALQLTRMAPISIGQLVHTYPVGTWNSSESASKCFATHKNGTHLDWSACTHLPCGYMEQLRVCPKVLCNSQEWHPSSLVSLYTPTLWVHGTAQSLPQSALQLTRMAPIFTGQLVHTYPVGTWNSSECASKCFATHKNSTHLDWSACTHLPCGYMEQLRVCLKVLCNSQEWHPSRLVSLYTPTLWVHGIAQSLPQSALQLTRMAPISIGQLVHTYPVGTWNSSESAPKCFATHKNGTHLHWYTPTLWVHGTAQSVPQSALQLTRMAPISIGQLVGTHLPCGYMEQLRVCLKVLCNSQEWHPSRLVSLYTPTLWVHGTAQSLPQSALQLTRMAPIFTGQLVHTYPVGTWNSSESAPKCFATHKNGTHLHWSACTHLPCGYMEQLIVCLKVLCNSQEWHPSRLVSLYTPTLWVHGTAQSLPQSALQLTRMAPISIGQLVHTYPVGTWNSSESAPKCFATHKNGTHLDWYTPTLWVHGIAQSLPQSALQLTRMAPIFTGQLVHTYPVGTWNSSECASKCFATHKNGTHLHWSACTHLPCGYMEQLRVCLKVLCNSQEWHPSPLVSLYTPTLWVHGTAQSVPQSALQLTRMAPISIGQLVHTYPVGTWNSSESAPKCFATHKNGTHLHWYTPTLWVHGTAQSLSQSALQLTRMAPIFTGQLVHTYPVGTWNSSESAPKCFATHKNGTHLHWSACTHLPCGYMEQLRVCPKVLCNSQEWHPSPLVSLYTPTLWVHGTAQSVPQSALQLTRMAPISTDQFENYLYTPTLWVHGIAQSLPQSALQLTRMAPISIGQLVHTFPVGTWNSSESAPKCFATHKNGTHLN